MERRMITWRLAALLCVPAMAAAQQAPTALDSAAQAAWSTGDWTAAARAYAALAARDTGTAQFRYRLGVALLGLGRPAEARPALQAAERLGAPVQQVAFRLALVAPEPDAAFRELRRATDAGLALLPSPPASEQALARLKADPRYADFVTAMDRNARPCMHDDRYKEFDFWLGTWDVRPTGQPQAPPARNVITKVNNGCVVHESWTAPGSAGQSFNIFDRTRGKWFQIWVDNSGGLHEYSGGIRDGAMVYEGEMPAPRPSTGRVRTRLTFTPSARGVRQFSERTVDGGSTWQVNYDLFYTRADSGSSNR
jgi:hypothetical protein